MNESWYPVLFAFFFLGMMAFSLLINSILLRFIKTLGTKNQPGATVRWSRETKPAIGGLSFYIVFLIGLCVAFFLFEIEDFLNRGDLGGLLVASSLGFFMGLTDDAYNTRPFLKFIVQIICGIILIVSGTVIQVFESDLLNTVVTIAWVAGIMNSINMIDNMDGIAAIAGIFIILAALGALIIFNRHLSFEFTMLLGLLAALSAFLFYNWHPSTIYMGDTGSQFLGVILAFVGIRYCWNVETLPSGSGGVAIGMAALLTVFVLPLCDTAVVTINRLRRGQSPFVGGKDHTTHHLSYCGYSDRRVAGIFIAISIIAVVLYFILIIFIPSEVNNLFAVFPVFFLLVFFSLFGITEYNKRRGKSVE